MAPPSAKQPFGSSAEVYEAVGGILRRIAASPGFGPALQQLDASLLFALSDPEATVLLDCAKGTSAEVKMGVDTGSGSTTVSISSDNASALFLGDLNASFALRNGALTVDGPAAVRFLRLTPLIRRQIAPLYEQHLRELGREDLLAGREPPPATVIEPYVGPVGEPEASSEHGVPSG